MSSPLKNADPAAWGLEVDKACSELHAKGKDDQLTLLPKAILGDLVPVLQWWERPSRGNGE